MPTAVITESSEKTMSSSMIWPMTAPNDGATRAVTVALFPFELLVDLARGLGEQEQAAADQDQVAARDAAPEHREQRLGEPDDPGEREQQRRCACTIAAISPTLRRAILLIRRAACRPGSR